MGIEIVTRTNSMAYAEDFKRINEDWISTNFWLEESDIQVLSDPQKYILDKGGNVFIALVDGCPAGTCALIVRDVFTCELAKMAVDTKARGRGIGYLLGVALIEKARQRGFTRIILEGNTKMTASISLYRKLGFKEVPLAEINQKQSIHERCNIFMELINNQNLQPEYYI
jgi:GNAT superfamily N-acetyltransferase